MSETLRHSGGTFGIRNDKVGWGVRGTPEQTNDPGGDWRIRSCDDRGPVQSLVSLKATSSEDVEPGESVSSDAEFAGGSPS